MKKNIINIIKIFLLLFMMTLGFFFTYAIVWFAVGLPESTWTLWVLSALAFISEGLYFKWTVKFV